MNELEILFDVNQQLFLIPRAIFLSILFLLAYLFILDNGKAIILRIQSLYNYKWVAAFFFYLAYIILSTLIAREKTIPYKKILEDFGVFHNGMINYELIENVMLFVPYSFLQLEAYRPSYPWKTSIILSFCTSTIIEICQLSFWLGEFQLSDIIHNTIGGLLGCGLWCLRKSIATYSNTHIKRTKKKNGKDSGKRALGKR